MIAARTPSKVRPARPASRVVAAATAAALVLIGGPANVPARAQTGSNAGIPLIRDAEIEQLMRDYTAPILKAAGLGNQNIKVVIIDDNSFNAFVMDAHRIFVNTGALKQATTPNQMIGVFAHETGHIVGGHLSKMRQELANVQTAMIVGMLLGAAAMVAGHGNTGMGNVGGAIFTAPQALGMSTLLSYQRAQEELADRAGVRFLTMTGQSAKGMYDTFKKFADDSLFSAHGANPYAQNHPMPQERMDALATLVHNQYWDKKDPPELQFRHDMMRAKLWGFTERPNVVLAHYPMTDTSLPARYARAISAYRFAGLQVSLPQIDGLIAAMPNNPYFYELKGQALLEGGTAGRGDRAAAPRRAARARPGADPDAAVAGDGRHQRSENGRRSDPDPARRRAQGAGSRRRLYDAGDGLRPQERSRRRRSRLGAGRFRPRRQQDRARTGRSRQAALPGRLARLGAGRRHRRLQQEPAQQPAVQVSSEYIIRTAPNDRTAPMKNLISARRTPVLFASLAAVAFAALPAVAETASTPTSTAGGIDAAAATPARQFGRAIGLDPDLTPEQQQAIGVLIKNYIAAHPEIVQDALDELDKRQKEAEADKARMTIKDNNATSVQFGAPGRPRQSARATSPWSSSSTTIAASASGRCPT